MPPRGSRRGWSDYAFVAPYGALFLTFTAVPLVFGLVMGFFQWELAKPLPPEFVGLENFRDN